LTYLTGQTSVEIRARFPISAAILLAMAGAREYTSAVRRAAPGSGSLSVSTFTTVILALAVLDLSSIALPAASAAQQRPATTEHGPAAATIPATALPAQCLHPAKASHPLQQLLEAIADHPTAGAYNTLGALFAQQGFDTCAISSFEAGLRLDPKNWEARYNLALALIKRGDRQRAIEELRRAIAAKPDSASAHHAFGTLLETDKKLPEAAAEYQAVLHADPHFPSGPIDLARVLAAQQKFGDAVTVLQEALKLSPAPDETVSLGAELGATYAESGDFPKATESLRQLPQRPPRARHRPGSTR
jgi:tetratricopeptide (TPR) repeat protein